MSPEEKLKGSFVLFLVYVWVRVLRLPKPTRIQRDIAEFLSTGPRRRFIAAFRGVGKTFITAAYIVWRLWRDPNMVIMVVSANERFAHKIASFIHMLIGAEDAISRTDVPWAELQARAGQRNSTLEFDVGPAGPNKDPSVAAFGITGQITGGRGDLLLFDDVEVPKNSETEALRQKLVDRIGEAAAILKPEGETIYLGTFQSMASIYRGLREKGYSMRLWPARYPLKDKLHLYEETLAPLLKGDLERDPSLMEPVSSTLGGSPTDPARFHDLDLIERETEWGVAGFQLQFMLDTSLTDADRFPLKTRDLVIMPTVRDVAPTRVAWGNSSDLLIKDLDNIGFDGDRLLKPFYVSRDDFQPYTGSLMEIDPSGSGADETSYVVTKFLNGLIYVTRWGGFKDGHSEATLHKLAEIAKEERVNLIREESNFGDGMFGRLLEPHLRALEYSVPIENHKVHKGMGHKEARIVNNLRPVLASHRLIMDQSVVEQDLQFAKSPTGDSELSGLYQLTHMQIARGALRHDDRVDVLSNAVSYWADYLAADAKEAEEARRLKAQEEFERQVFGSAIFGERWNKGRNRMKRAKGRRRS